MYILYVCFELHVYVYSSRTISNIPDVSCSTPRRDPYPIFGL